MLHDRTLWNATATVGFGFAVGFGIVYKYITNKITRELDYLYDFDNWKPFSVWKRRCEQEAGLQINSLRVIDKCMFGKRLGFLYVDVDASYEGRKVPGKILFRGPSCCVLMWCVIDGNVFALLIKQLRLPIGKFIWEIPAGMIDESDNIHGKMMDEIREETGIEPESDKLHYMGKGFTSCDLLDEEISFYEMEIDRPTSLNVNTCGTDEEFISDIQLFSIDEHFCEDVKFLAAISLFKNHWSYPSK